MSVVNYFTINQRIRAEETVGGSGTRVYALDALGSVTHTFTSAGLVENTYQHAPYGTRVAKTGTAIDPLFTWAGGWGYSSGTSNNSKFYVRAREYDGLTARWTTADPLYARNRNPYAYAGASPANLVDPSGLIAITVNSFIHKDQDYDSQTVTDCYGKRSSLWIPAPFNFSHLAYYRGDHRDFSLGESGKTSRAFTTLEFEDCRIGDLNYGDVRFIRAASDRTQGMVRDLLGSCLLYQNPRPTFNLKLEEVKNLYHNDKQGATRIKYLYTARDPLVFNSPHLMMEVTLNLFADFCGGSVSVLATATHTDYPWAEAYASEQTNRLWLFTHSATVDDLLGGLLRISMDAGSASFQISACKNCCKKK